jgi:hypothetical protein
MKRNLGFDEVMIVNPYEPGSNANQGVRFMRFNGAPPEMGYYAEPPGQYGYYAEPPGQYGYYAEAPHMEGYYANAPEHYGEFAPGYSQAEPVGYIAENYLMGYYGDPYAGAYAEYGPMGYYGYYAEAPHMEGYYAEAPHMEGYYAEAPHMEGYYAEAPHMEGYYAEAPHMEGYNGYAPRGYYAESPAQAQYAEAPGYAQYAEAGEMPGYANYEPLAETYSQMGDYGAYGAEYGEDYSGYVRETEPRYNAGCPMPTNVHGYGDVQAVDGYVRPSTVNPTCGQFTPQPKQSSVVPDGFKPLW